jgi:eukaryotic-like serine/threonine-protein kinase
VLLKPLAKGGMGEIYLAAGGEVGGFEKLCVIKKVITEKADRAKANRFLDEAKVVLRLSHSALVTTFDAGDVRGEFYIAMELVEGKDLREVWNRCVRTRQRIPLDVALHVVREVARALSYVHTYGDLKLVHRDVAPPNILLAYVGDVKLTDFGLARSILKQEHTAPGVVFGRAAYLAPEQARGEVADARTDVYTLGIVLWELLTGQQFLQLGGLDPAAALAIVRHPKLVPPSTRAPWITPALDRVVTRALAADRNERFATAEELRQALNEVIGEVAPRADAGRVAEFLRGIYADTIDEERVERERYLKEVIPQFRASPPDDSDPTPVGATDPPQVARPARPPAKEAAPKAAPEAPRPTRPSQSVRPPGLPGLPPPTPPPASNGAPVRRLTTPKLPVAAVAAAPAPITSAGPSVARMALGARIVAGCRLIRPLVDGRVGSVHVGLRAGSTDEVSVRMLESPRAFDPPALERVRQETARMAALRHPNVAAVSEVIVGEGGALHFIGEPLAGTTLANVLREHRRLEGGRALDIAAQVSRALQAAHGAGILHHHLEPERVMIMPGTSGDRVKVLDFGLAARGGSTLDAASALYRAPEQLTGTSADLRADVYAVAALLYEMVTGAPPHAASADPIARKLAEPVQSPRMFRPEIPAQLEALIMSALDRDPAARPATLAAFEDVLVTVTRAREAEPHADEAERATPPVSADRRRARREAAFRAIGELLTVQEARPEADLLPPVIGPPVDGHDSAERPTPLQAPSAAMVAATAEATFEVPTARDAFAWTPPAPGASPSSPTVGGAMLERYGDHSAGKTRALVLVVVALGLAGVAAFLLLR